MNEDDHADDRRDANDRWIEIAMLIGVVVVILSIITGIIIEGVRTWVS